MNQTPVIRPTLFVPDVHRWHEFFSAFGLTDVVTADGWSVMAAGAGRLALHAVEPGAGLAGVTKLAWEVTDLGTYAEACERAGVSARSVRLDQGAAVEVDLGEAGIAVVDAATPGDAGLGDVAPGALAVEAVCYVRSTDRAARRAASSGWTRRISSDGGWADLTAHGILAFHGGVAAPLGDGASTCELAFETGDVDALAARLRAHGLEGATVVDEAYSRTLRVPAPDGTTVWVNETQRDLYGYQLATHRPAAE